MKLIEASKQDKIFYFVGINWKKNKENVKNIIVMLKMLVLKMLKKNNA